MKLSKYVPFVPNCYSSISPKALTNPKTHKREAQSDNSRRENKLFLKPRMQDTFSIFLVVFHY